MNEWLELLFFLTLSGSMVFAAAVVVRYVFARWVPKWFLCCLWLPVLFSFLLPLGSRYSLITDWKVKQEAAAPTETYSPQVDHPAAGGRVFDLQFDSVVADQAPLTFSTPRVIRQICAAQVRLLISPKSNTNELYHFLFPLWLCGALLISSWKLIGYHRFRRRLLSVTRFPEEWEESMLRRFAGNGKVPLLLHSPKANGPVLTGVCKCTLFLPDEAYPPEVLEDVLAHELSHWKRRDLTLKWLTAFVLSVHWFNPVCWWISVQIDRDCEFACDERALKNQSLERRQRYGRTLVLVAASQGSARSLTAPMYTQKQRLKERLELIMSNKKSGRYITIALCLATLLMGLSTMLLGVYAGNIDTGESPKSSTPAESEQAESPGNSAPAESELTGDSGNLTPAEPEPAGDSGDLAPAESEPAESPVLQVAPTPSEEQGQLLLPLEADQLKVSAHFGSRVNPVSGETITHNGVDFRADSGTDIMAVSDGVVITSAFDSPYGDYVVISHSDGRTTLYANMLYNSRAVAEGDTVTAGQIIGQVGSTGLSTGPHLHFELWQDGVAVDPLDFLTAN